MLTEEKIKQVRKLLRSGVPQGEIRNVLIAEGYTEEDMEKIFAPHRPDMRGWYLVFTIVFFLIGIYTLTAYGSFLFLLFAAAMYSVYHFEKLRIEKNPD